MNTQKRTPKALQTEQNIRQVAQTLFAQKGYENTTTREISECAEVAEGTVFKYFPTKLDILSAVMHDFFVRLQATTEAAVNSEADAYQQLRAFARVYLRVAAEEWHLARIIVQYGRYGHDEAFMTQFAKYNREYVAILTRILETLRKTGRIRASTPLSLIREMFFGSVEHFAMRHFPDKRPYDLDVYCDHLLDLLAFGFSTGVQSSSEN